MRVMLLGLLGWLLASSAQAQMREPPACPSLPGVQLLWANPQTRFVIFGEYHGTAEIPALFADVVCHASGSRPVIVALEMQANTQPAFDAFMASDGSAPARSAFLASRAWPNSPDGRSSEAILAMIERVRALKAAGRPVRLVGFLPQGRPPAFNQNYHELGMAAALAEAAFADPTALVVTLVGNVHSSKTPLEFETTLVPAAMHLPDAHTIALTYAPAGGRAWNCRQSGCGDNPFNGSDTSPRGVKLYGETRKGYDGAYSPGRPYTASPPATR